MIITITPNPAMDQSYTTSGFRPDKTFRAADANRRPGGRGINVSIILKQLGYDSAAMGFLAGHTGSFIHDDLLSRGISTNFVNIGGENRITTYIRDGEEGIETAVTENGPTVSDDESKRFFTKLSRVLNRAEAVYMGGALPPGIPDTFYRDTVDEARRLNIPVFLTATGTPLDRAIEALPTVVKIDHRSSAMIRNISQTALDHIIQSCKRIFNEGVDWIISSYFNRSDIFCTTKGFFMGEIDQDGVRTYRGADDALMAGMIVARKEHMGIDDTIRFAMACVRETVIWPEKGLRSRANVEESMAGVIVKKL